MKKKPLIIILVILLLVIAAGGTYYMLVLKGQSANAEPEQKSYTYALDDSFITNVKDSRKLFKTSIVLVADAEDLQETLDANQYVIRDTILFILRNLTEADICSDAIQDSLRKEIPEALNKALKINSITSIYFGDFVMQ
mgnify:CR=1 FL=1